MYKRDLVFNNLQWLICHQTKPNQTKHIQYSDSFVQKNRRKIYKIYSNKDSHHRKETYITKKIIP